MNKELKTNFNRRNFIRASAVTGLGLSLNLYSCTKKSDAAPEKEDEKDNENDGDNSIKLLGVIFPSFMDIERGGEMNIQGKGFETGDKIIFQSQTDVNKEYIVDIKTITDEYITIVLSSELSSDKYRLKAKRDANIVYLGPAITLNVVFNAHIPDKEGMTVKGVVYSGGAGLANIVVSDGFEVTKTDGNGIYYLASAKKSGYVFVSIPGNYEVETEDSLPLFFKRLSTSLTVELHDFELKPVNNEKHVVMVMTDMHLANRNQDIKQFQQGFLVDVNKSIQSYESSGNKVYGLTLGDLTWDGFWYSNKYALPEYRAQMKDIKTTVFNAIGNHDNDPYVASDWYSEKKFRDILGPTYYSFNLGKVHYIVLDNTEYLNDGGALGTMGSRNYNAKIVADQMTWLKRDLATIEDKSTPIVIGMHIQLSKNPSLSGQQPTTSYRMDNAAEFVDALNGFSKVHILTGHTHINYNIENSSYLMEHNTAAVCATWWWTGRDNYAGNHICKDGSPGGYSVWEIENRDLKWYYKSINYEKEYQFRAYDLNEIHVTPQKFASGYTGNDWATYSKGYEVKNTNNEVLINVWDHDSKWEVEVTEEGTPLQVNRVRVYDPLHVISYQAQRLNVNAVPSTDFVTSLTAHMFKVKASKADSTLQITVTDRFGNVYTEEMVRPKAFGYLMR